MKLKKISFVLLITIFILGFFLGYLSAQDENLMHFRKTEDALVTRVTDGDTIVIDGGERVRLLGIDTPERGDDYYNEAKEFLEERILMKNVKLERSVEDKDMYDRLLRYVWINDSLINLELVERGYASAYFYNENEKYKDLIADAEKKAIEKKIGIFSQNNSQNLSLLSAD